MLVVLLIFSLLRATFPSPNSCLVFRALLYFPKISLCFLGSLFWISNPVLMVWIYDVDMVSYMDYWKHQRHVPLYRIFLTLMSPVTQWKHLEAFHVICEEFGRVLILSELYSNNFCQLSKKPFLFITNQIWCNFPCDINSKRELFSCLLSFSCVGPLFHNSIVYFLITSD